jgi:insertion element IS1 protein InsB
VLGDHSAQTFKPLWAVVATWQCYLALLNDAMISPDWGQIHKAFRNRFIARFSNACYFYVTDGWSVYPGFIPAGDQIVSKTYMTRVEGENTRLRHYLARLHRKTLCYSKSVELLAHSIRLLLHYLKFREVPIPQSMKRFLKALWICPQSGEIIASFSNARKTA